MMRTSFTSGLISLLWLGGFFCALMPFPAYEAHSFGLSFLLVCAALLVALAGAAGRDEVRLPQTPLLYIVCGFWVLAFVSTVLSAVPYVSFIYFCFFSVLPMTLFMTLLHPDRDYFFKMSGVVLAVFYAALSLGSLYQYFFMPEMLSNGFARWPLANPNSLAALLSLGFFGALSWMLSAPSRLQSNMGLFLSIFIFAALVTTGSRGAMVSLLAALAVFLMFAPAHFKKHRRCSLILFVSAVAVFAALSLLPHAGQWSLAGRVAETAAGAKPVLWSRPDIWLSTGEIIRDHFWTGTGIGTFFLYYPAVRAGDVTSAGLMAHNDPLQFWAEMGVLAPVLFYAFAVGAALRTFKAMKALPPEDMRRIYILGPFCGLGAMVVHAHFTFNFYVLVLLLAAGFLTGAWFFQTQKIIAPEAAQATGKKTLFMALPLMALAAFFVMIHGSYILTQRASVYAEEGNFEAFVRDVNAAGKLSMQKNERGFLMAASVPMGVIETQGPTLSAEEIRALFRQSYELLDQAQALNPRDAGVLYQKARVLQNASAFTDLAVMQTPENLLIKALQLNPAHLGARMMLAQLYEAGGDRPRALEVLKAGLQWPYVHQDPLPYYQQTAVMSLALSDEETRARALRKMMSVQKKQANARRVKAGAGRTGP